MKLLKDIHAEGLGFGGAKRVGAALIFAFCVFGLVEAFLTLVDMLPDFTTVVHLFQSVFDNDAARAYSLISFTYMVGMGMFQVLLAVDVSDHLHKHKNPLKYNGDLSVAGQNVFIMASMFSMVIIIAFALVLFLGPAAPKPTIGNLLGPVMTILLGFTACTGIVAKLLASEKNFNVQCILSGMTYVPALCLAIIGGTKLHFAGLSALFVLTYTLRTFGYELAYAKRGVRYLNETKG